MLEFVFAVQKCIGKAAPGIMALRRIRLVDPSITLDT